MKKLFRVSVSLNFEMFVAADGIEKAEEAAPACARLAVGQAEPDVGPAFRVRELADESESDSPVFCFGTEAEEVEGFAAGAYLEALREELLKADF